MFEESALDVARREEGGSRFLVVSPDMVVSKALKVPLGMVDGEMHVIPDIVRTSIFSSFLFFVPKTSWPVPLLLTLASKSSSFSLLIAM